MKRNGFLLVEVIVAIFIFSIVFVYFLGMISLSLRANNLAKEKNIAFNLAKEPIEVLRIIRDGGSWDDFSSFAVGVSYRLQRAGNNWSLAQGEENINGFVRQIFFESVMRNSQKNIVSIGGTIDGNTRKASVKVYFSGKQVEIIDYFTNWQ